jgi:crotonobetainyl-CoA:carnitine CoA-transferase CaiB-like acyl-CoA transferase
VTENTDHSPDTDARPLDGVRVIELAQWVAGPSAAGTLADWGADVIKVEAPTGDPQRAMFASVGIDKAIPNPSFAQDNRGKRSVVLDLRDPEGRHDFERLLETADVFVTNVRLDGLERLDLTPSAVAGRHPTLVVASLTGYGAVGPARDVPGYDIGAFVARTGLARTNAPESLPPVNLKSAIGDHMTGITTVSAIMAALFRRERTGRGMVVETSLFQTGMYAVSWDLSTQLTFGRLSRMKARESYDQPLVNSYRAGDGRWFYLIGLEMMRHFPGVCRAIGQPDLVSDERFASGGRIREHREELIAILDEVFAAQPLPHWAERFDANDVWWAPCQTMAEVAEDPQAHALDTFIETIDDSYTGELPDGPIHTVATPARFNGEVFHPRRPVPALGQHTSEVLDELGT